MYITKRTLHHRSGFISKGGKVPKDYPRLTEGLRGGWIVEIADPAAPPGPVKPPKPTVVPTAVATEVPTTIVTSPDSNEPVKDPAAPGLPGEGDAIDTIDWLGSMAKKSLLAAGITTIGDLGPYSILELVKLKGIGEATAEKLVLAFRDLRDEVDGPVIDNEPETETVEYEGGESGQGDGSA